MGKKKQVSFTSEGVGDIRNDKPVVYRIRDSNNQIIYTGSAKRGRVEDRLREHLPGSADAIPSGETVEITQKSSIDEAQRSEATAIKRSKPKYNKRGK